MKLHARAAVEQHKHDDKSNNHMWENHYLPEIITGFHQRGATDEEIAAGRISDEFVDGIYCRVMRIEIANYRTNVDIPIGELSLSVRALNCLKTLGVRTVGDLLAVPASELLKTPNLGRATYNQLSEALREIGFNPWPPYEKPKKAKTPQRIAYRRGIGKSQLSYS